MRVSEKLKSAGRFMVLVYNELDRTRAFVVAAALAFYFLLSMIPLLVVLSLVLRTFAPPNVFVDLLWELSTLMPRYAMTMVSHVVDGILKPHPTGVVSVGVLGYLWASSGGFAAAIEALDIAYDAEKHRPWWRDRLQALALTFTSGGLMLISLFALFGGPRFGRFLMLALDLPWEFSATWPLIRLAVTFVTFVLGLEILYYLGPNIKQRFWSTLPGALFAMACWLAGSYGMNFYLTHMSNYDKMYGSVGALIALMIWMYVVMVAVLAGAEMNAEILKQRNKVLKGQIGSQVKVIKGFAG